MQLILVVLAAIGSVVALFMPDPKAIIVSLVGVVLVVLCSLQLRIYRELGRISAGRSRLLRLIVVVILAGAAVWIYER